MGDLAGGLWSVIAILAALQRRTAVDEPQHIDISLLEGLTGLLGYLGQMSLLTGEAPPRMGSDHHSVVPYGRFDVKDGYLVIALHVGNFWRQFCSAIGREDLVEDPRFRSSRLRLQNRDELLAILGEVLIQRTRAEWQQVLDAADIPHAPVLDVTEALAQDQMLERGVLRTMTHPDAGDVTVVGPVVRFVGEPPPELRPPPRLGEHTRDVCMTLLGMSADDVDRLIAGGAISELDLDLDRSTQ